MQTPDTTTHRTNRNGSSAKFRPLAHLQPLLIGPASCSEGSRLREFSSISREFSTGPREFPGTRAPRAVMANFHRRKVGRSSSYRRMIDKAVIQLGRSFCEATFAQPSFIISYLYGGKF